MAETDRPGDASRRNFLKFVGVAAPAAAAAATGTAAAADVDQPEAEGNGLRDTAHVRAYIASARF
ncbi:hypothetical protein [Roseivivax isoporae]|uniref:Twin-arginine translocation pathway signal protein n=1 Tax=Roseivivax isoporae LMG 25204 TaxID=1449351 RepID=X7FBM2_9RHOB|nr:hypothetical protein [Roseivivax isoporae]ETX30307.1 hypothetical protein RISW2_15845 [Roseivivax isoporae LMG 25204]